MTSKSNSIPSSPMSSQAAQRIQIAKANGGSVPKGRFSARATSATSKK